MVRDATPNAGDAKANVPLSVSPAPTALVPELRSDSKTLPSVPVTAPSFSATIAGTPTMVTLSVVVALSPSPSAMP